MRTGKGRARFHPGTTTRKRDMNTLKLTALAATASVAALATSANAQYVWPEAFINGAGASSITTAHVQVLNCIAAPANRVGAGLVNNTINPVAPGRFDWLPPANVANPDFDCATESVQPNFKGRYMSTGSGTGRQFWRTFTNTLPGTLANNNNPFVQLLGEPVWNNVQYAFSDTPGSFSDFTGYTAAAGAAGTGKAIQVPLYVVPVAFSYENVYGIKETAGGPVNLTFDNRFVRNVNGQPVGGIRMTKNVYCKIWNGEITNWNDAAITALNTRTLQDKVNDTVARWNADGVPIRIVGRLDRSGTTDIFTRALAAQCDPFVTINKFDQASEQLPFFPGISGFDANGNDLGPIDMEVVAAGSGSRYRPTATVTGTNFANTVNSADRNSISGALFVRNTSLPGGGQIVETEGAERPGLFLLANTATAVESAVIFPADKVSPSDATVKLNGKLGYNGGDFVAPTAGKPLFAAALQQGTGTTYVMPDAFQSSRPFLEILPPEQTTANGRWNVAGETRTAADVNNVQQPVQRRNPKSWTDVLTNTPGTSVSNPTGGYPMVGTAQFFSYTCFSNVAKRNALTWMFAAYISRLQAKSDGTPLSSLTFTGADNPGNPIGSTYRGLGTIAQTGLGPMPEPWQNGMFITFLQNSPQTNGFPAGDPRRSRLGEENLWIIERLPNRANQVDGIGINDIKGNPECTPGLGA